MTLFKKRKELEADQKELEEVKERSKKVEKLRADLQAHLRDNNFGSRLYAQMIQNWK